jgi:hypothetical protein
MKLVLVVLLTIFSVCHAKSVVYEYGFDSPEILHFQGVDKIYVEHLSQSITANKPVLPVKLAKIMLPPNIKITNVTSQRLDQTLLSEALNLEISNRSVPMSVSTGQSVNKLSFQNIDFEAVYPKTMTYGSMQKYHGYNILLAKLYPVYVTPDKHVFYTHKIQIRIEYETLATESANSNVVNPKHRQIVKSFIDNKTNEFMDEYQENALEKESYDYLILAPSKIISTTRGSNLQTFKTFLENERGLSVKIKDVKDVISNSEGVDDPQKIRNFLRNEYKTYGIKYLLLAGDSDGWRPQIPVRKIYSSVRGYNGSWKTITQSIATDFYYSCLDGTYNHNNNDKWGEKNDGDNGNDVDFLCELTVGRWSVDDSTQLDMSVKKSIQAYDLKSRSKNVLLVGEKLFAELGLWGKGYMNGLVGVVDDHNFVSNGYDDSWNIKTLFEKDKGWSASILKDSIRKNDFLMLNHIGHSNAYMNMKINSRRYSGMQNPNPYFLYSQGCFAGDFTVNASIAEVMVNKKGGPFAAVANSSYGLGPEDPDPDSTPTPGTSQILHRHFINNVLNNNYLAFAEAHKKSKEDILVYIDHGEARWVTWAATYFGDPAIKP